MVDKQLDRKNQHGVTVRDALTFWQIGEVLEATGSIMLATELEKYPIEASLGTAWHQLSPIAQRAAADAWCG